MGADTRQRVEKFIVDALLLGDAAQLPGPGESLLEAGVIDSTGVLELIEFLEEEFDIQIDDTETVPANLDGVDRIVAFVDRKAG